MTTALFAQWRPVSCGVRVIPIVSSDNDSGTFNLAYCAEGLDLIADLGDQGGAPGACLSLAKFGDFSLIDNLYFSRQYSMKETKTSMIRWLPSCPDDINYLP
jgi:hypothetical protein